MALLGKRSKKRRGSDTLDHRKVEESKVAIFQDRGCTILHNLLHIMPTLTAAAAAVLELNFTHVSFVGLCFPNVKTSLNAFQFAAKFHEIFLAALLSAVVLQSHAVRAL